MKKTASQLKDKSKEYSKGRTYALVGAKLGRKPKTEKPPQWSEEYWSGYLVGCNESKEKYSSEEIEMEKGRTTAMKDFSGGRKKLSKPPDWTDIAWKSYQEKTQELHNTKPDTSFKDSAIKAKATTDANRGKKRKRPDDWNDQEWELYEAKLNQLIENKEINPDYQWGLTQLRSRTTQGLPPYKKQPKTWNAEQWRGYSENVEKYQYQDAESRSGKTTALDHLYCGTPYTEPPELWSDEKWDGYIKTIQEKNVSEEELESRRLARNAKYQAYSGGKLITDHKNLSEIQSLESQLTYLETRVKLGIDKTKATERRDKRNGRMAASRGERVKSGSKAYVKAYNKYIKDHQLTDKDLDYNKGKRKGNSDATNDIPRINEKPAKMNDAEWNGYNDGYDCTPAKISNNSYEFFNEQSSTLKSTNTNVENVTDVMMIQNN